VSSVTLMSVPAVFSSACIIPMMLSSFMSVSVSVSFAFPSPPISPYISIWHSFIHNRTAAKTRRHPDYRPGDPPDGDAAPWAIISGGYKPAPAVGSIPVPAIKENIYTHIRRVIYVRSGYHGQSWRCGYYQSGQWNRNTDIDFGIAVDGERKGR
jgi:hypothetical protein